MRGGLVRAADRVAYWHTAAEEPPELEPADLGYGDEAYEPVTSGPPTGAPPEVTVTKSKKFLQPANKLKDILETQTYPEEGSGYSQHTHPAVKGFFDSPQGQAFSKSYIKPNYQDQLKTHLGDENYEKLLYHMPEEHHTALTQHAQKPAPNTNKFTKPLNTLNSLLSQPGTTGQSVADFLDKHQGFAKSYMKPEYQDAIKGHLGEKNYDELQKHLTDIGQKPPGVPAKAAPSTFKQELEQATGQQFGPHWGEGPEYGTNKDDLAEIIQLHQQSKTPQAAEAAKNLQAVYDKYYGEQPKQQATWTDYQKMTPAQQAAHDKVFGAPKAKQPMEQGYELGVPPENVIGFNPNDPESIKAGWGAVSDIVNKKAPIKGLGNEIAQIYGKGPEATFHAGGKNFDELPPSQQKYYLNSLIDSATPKHKEKLQALHDKHFGEPSDQDEIDAIKSGPQQELYHVLTKSGVPDTPELHSYLDSLDTATAVNLAEGVVDPLQHYQQYGQQAPTGIEDLTGPGTGTGGLMGGPLLPLLQHPQVQPEDLQEWFKQHPNLAPQNALDLFGSDSEWAEPYAKLQELLGQTPDQGEIEQIQQLLEPVGEQPPGFQAYVDSLGSAADQVDLQEAWKGLGPAEKQGWADAEAKYQQIHKQPEPGVQHPALVQAMQQVAPNSPTDWNSMDDASIKQALEHMLKYLPETEGYEQHVPKLQGVYDKFFNKQPAAGGIPMGGLSGEAQPVSGIELSPELRAEYYGDIKEYLGAQGYGNDDQMSQYLATLSDSQVHDLGQNLSKAVEGYENWLGGPAAEPAAQETDWSQWPDPAWVAESGFVPWMNELDEAHPGAWKAYNEDPTVAKGYMNSFMSEQPSDEDEIEAIQAEQQPLLPGAEWANNYLPGEEEPWTDEELAQLPANGYAMQQWNKLSPEEQQQWAQNPPQQPGQGQGLGDKLHAAFPAFDPDVWNLLSPEVAKDSIEKYLSGASGYGASLQGNPQLQQIYDEHFSQDHPLTPAGLEKDLKDAFGGTAAASWLAKPESIPDYLNSVALGGGDNGVKAKALQQKYKDYDFGGGAAQPPQSHVDHAKILDSYGEPSEDFMQWFAQDNAHTWGAQPAHDKQLLEMLADPENKWTQQKVKGYLKHQDAIAQMYDEYSAHASPAYQNLLDTAQSGFFDDQNDYDHYLGIIESPEFKKWFNAQAPEDQELHSKYPDSAVNDFEFEQENANQPPPGADDPGFQEYYSDNVNADEGAWEAESPEQKAHHYQEWQNEGSAIKEYYQELAAQATFDPDAFVKEYKATFPGTAWGKKEMGKPEDAIKVLKGIIDEDEYDALGDPRDPDQYPSYGDYEEAQEHFEQGKIKAQQLYDKWFGAGAGQQGDLGTFIEEPEPAAAGLSGVSQDTLGSEVPMSFLEGGYDAKPPYKWEPGAQAWLAEKGITSPSDVTYSKLQPLMAEWEQVTGEQQNQYAMAEAQGGYTPANQVPPDPEDLAELKKSMQGHGYLTDLDDYKQWENTLTQADMQAFYGNAQAAKDSFDNFLQENYPFEEEEGQPDPSDPDFVAFVKKMSGFNNVEAYLKANKQWDLPKLWNKYQKAKNFDPVALTKELHSALGGYSTNWDEMHQNGTLWKNKTYDQAASDLEELLPIYDDKPELQALWDKYFGSGPAAQAGAPAAGVPTAENIKNYALKNLHYGPNAGLFTELANAQSPEEMQAVLEEQKQWMADNGSEDGVAEAQDMIDYFFKGQPSMWDFSGGGKPGDNPNFKQWVGHQMDSYDMSVKLYNSVMAYPAVATAWAALSDDEKTELTEDVSTQNQWVNQVKSGANPEDVAKAKRELEGPSTLPPIDVAALNADLESIYGFDVLFPFTESQTPEEIKEALEGPTWLGDSSDSQDNLDALQQVYDKYFPQQAQQASSFDLSVKPTNAQIDQVAAKAGDYLLPDNLVQYYKSLDPQEWKDKIDYYTKNPPEPTSAWDAIISGLKELGGGQAPAGGQAPTGTGHFDSGDVHSKLYDFFGYNSSGLSQEQKNSIATAIIQHKADGSPEHQDIEAYLKQKYPTSYKKWEADHQELFEAPAGGLLKGGTPTPEQAQEMAAEWSKIFPGNSWDFTDADDIEAFKPQLEAALAGNETDDDDWDWDVTQEHAGQQFYNKWFGGQGEPGGFGGPATAGGDAVQTMQNNLDTIAAYLDAKGWDTSGHAYQKWVGSLTPKQVEFFANNPSEAHEAFDDYKPSENSQVNYTLPDFGEQAPADKPPLTPELIKHIYDTNNYGYLDSAHSPTGSGLDIELPEEWGSDPVQQQQIFQALIQQHKDDGLNGVANQLQEIYDKQFGQAPAQAPSAAPAAPDVAPLKPSDEEIDAAVAAGDLTPHVGQALKELGPLAWGKNWEAGKNSPPQSAWGQIHKWMGSKSAAPKPYDAAEAQVDYQDIFPNSAKIDMFETPEGAKKQLETVIKNLTSKVEQYSGATKENYQKKLDKAQAMQQKWFGGGAAGPPPPPSNPPFDWDAFGPEFKAMFPQSKWADSVQSEQDAKSKLFATPSGLIPSKNKDFPDSDKTKEMNDWAQKWFPQEFAAFQANQQSQGAAAPAQSAAVPTYTPEQLYAQVASASDPDMVTPEFQQWFMEQNSTQQHFYAGNPEAAAVAWEEENLPPPPPAAPFKSQPLNPEELTHWATNKPKGEAAWKNFASWWGATQLSPEDEAGLYDAWFGKDVAPDKANAWFQAMFEHQAEPGEGDLGLEEGIPAWSTAAWAFGKNAEKEWPVFQAWATKHPGVPKGASIKQKVAIWNGLPASEKQSFAEEYFPTGGIDTKAVVDALKAAYPDSNWSKWEQMTQPVLMANMKKLVNAGEVPAMKISNEYLGTDHPIPEEAPPEEVAPEPEAAAPPPLPPMESLPDWVQQQIGGSSSQNQKDDLTRQFVDLAHFADSVGQGQVLATKAAASQLGKFWQEDVPAYIKAQVNTMDSPPWSDLDGFKAWMDAQPKAQDAIAQIVPDFHATSYPWSYGSSYDPEKQDELGEVIWAADPAARQQLLEVQSSFFGPGKTTLAQSLKAIDPDKDWDTLLQKVKTKNSAPNLLKKLLKEEQDPVKWAQYAAAFAGHFAKPNEPRDILPTGIKALNDFFKTKSPGWKPDADDWRRLIQFKQNYPNLDLGYMPHFSASAFPEHAELADQLAAAGYGKKFLPFYGWTPPSTSTSTAKYTGFTVDPASYGIIPPAKTYSVPPAGAKNKDLDLLQKAMEGFKPGYFTDEDKKTIASDPFANWWNKASPGYRNQMRDHPSLALDDFYDFMSGGSTYSPVIEGPVPASEKWYDVMGYGGPKPGDIPGQPKAMTVNPASGTKWPEQVKNIKFPRHLDEQETLPLGPGEHFAPEYAPMPIYRLLSNPRISLDFDPNDIPQWMQGKSQHEKQIWRETQKARLRKIDEILNGKPKVRDPVKDYEKFRSWADNNSMTPEQVEEVGDILFSSQTSLPPGEKWHQLEEWAAKENVPREKLFSLAEMQGTLAPMEGKPGNYNHPELGRLILDYLEAKGGLGRHWTRDKDKLYEGVGGVQSKPTADERSFSVMLSGLWGGRGMGTWRDFAEYEPMSGSEREWSLRSGVDNPEREGAPVHIFRLQIPDPDGDLHDLIDYGPMSLWAPGRNETASGKEVLDKPSLATELNKVLGGTLKREDWDHLKPGWQAEQAFYKLWQDNKEKLKDPDPRHPTNPKLKEFNKIWRDFFVGRPEIALKPHIRRASLGPQTRIAMAVPPEDIYRLAALWEVPNVERYGMVNFSARPRNWQEVKEFAQDVNGALWAQRSLAKEHLFGIPNKRHPEYQQDDEPERELVHLSRIMELEEGFDRMVEAARHRESSAPY